MGFWGLFVFRPLPAVLRGYSWKRLGDCLGVPRIKHKSIVCKKAPNPLYSVLCTRVLRLQEDKASALPALISLQPSGYSFIYLFVFVLFGLGGTPEVFRGYLVQVFLGFVIRNYSRQCSGNQPNEVLGIEPRFNALPSALSLQSHSSSFNMTLWFFLVGRTIARVHQREK